eukprot:2619516-Amphidinium_carterae.2
MGRAPHIIRSSKVTSPSHPIEAQGNVGPLRARRIWFAMSTDAQSQKLFYVVDDFSTAHSRLSPNEQHVVSVSFLFAYCVWHFEEETISETQKTVATLVEKVDKSHAQ